MFRQRGVAVELRDVRCVSIPGATAGVDRNCRDSLCASGLHLCTLVALWLGERWGPRCVSRSRLTRFDGDCAYVKRYWLRRCDAACDASLSAATGASILDRAAILVYPMNGRCSPAGQR